MSNWWYATSVDVEQGSNLIRVNTGDDTRYFERGSCWLKIAGHDAVETDGLITDGSDTFIRLVKDWDGQTDTGRRAFAFRTVPDFQGVADKLALNIEASQGVVDNVISKMGTILTSTDESVVIETPEGDVSVVPWGRVKEQIEDEWEVIRDDVTQTEARLRVEERLKRNASFYADFTQDDAIVTTGLSKVASGIADAIDVTAADGVSGEGADGRIYTVGANTPAIVWGEGECQGLQTAPQSTNLVLRSRVEIDDLLLTRAQAETTSIPSPFGSEDYVRLWGDTDSSSPSYFRTLSSSGITSPSGIISVQGFFKPDGVIFATISIGTGLGNLAVLNCDTLEAGHLGANIQSIQAERLADGSVRFAAIRNVGGDDANCYLGASDREEGGAYIGDESQSMLISGFQVEQGYPTPYIPTEGSQVVRDSVSADHLFGPTTLSSGVTFYVEFIYQKIGTLGVVASLSNDSFTQRAYIAVSETGDVLFNTRNEGLGVSNLNLTLIAESNISNGELVRVCVRLFRDRTNAIANGGRFSSNRSSSILPLPVRHIGIGKQGGGSTSFALSQISHIAMVPFALSDAEAIALTTLED